MLNCFDKINWKQNPTNLSELFIDVRSASKEDVNFLLNEDMVNHIFQKRNDRIEMHLRMRQSDKIEVCEMDFSKIKPVKSVSPSLRRKISPDTQQDGKTGVYSIFHPDSNRWLTPLGWGYVQNHFDIVPQKLNKSRLSVSLAPKFAADSGAAWGVRKIEWQSSASSVSVANGNHVVEFKPIEGWDTPKAKKIYIGEDVDSTISARYTLSRPKLMHQEPLNVLFFFLIAFFISIVSYYLGNPFTPSTLSAALSPPEVISQGAQWRIERGNWQTGGEMLELEAGEYALEFKSVDGWQSPPQQKIHLKEGQLSQINAAYTKRIPSYMAVAGRSITVQINPPEAVQAGAGWKLEGPGEWRAGGEKISGLINIPYTVIFKQVKGWKKPANLEFSDHGPGMTTGKGVYEKVVAEVWTNQP